MQFSLSNFGKQNTPKIGQQIGDICLLVATITGALLTPEFAFLMPMIGGVIGTDAAGVTILLTHIMSTTGLIKLVTKFLGVKPSETAQNAAKEGIQ